MKLSQLLCLLLVFSLASLHRAPLFHLLFRKTLLYLQRCSTLLLFLLPMIFRIQVICNKVCFQNVKLLSISQYKTCFNFLLSSMRARLVIVENVNIRQEVVEDSTSCESHGMFKVRRNSRRESPTTYLLHHSFFYPLDRLKQRNIK